MRFAVNSNIWGNGQFTAVPSLIIDKHMKLCGSLPLKVILLILRDSENFCSISSIAEKLKADTGDIGDAINYWIEAGILVEQNSKSTPKVFEEPQKIHEESSQNSVFRKKDTEEPIKVPDLHEKKMLLSREEVCKLIENDRLLSDLLKEGQAIFGKLFTSADVDTLVTLYSYYALSPHFIVTLLTYCASIEKRGMAYAKNVAMTWISEGIDDQTVDSHVDKLMHQRTLEGRLRKRMGIQRNFITYEKKYISKWYQDFGYDQDMIIAAFENNVTAIGKLNFKYMDKILCDWNQKGYRTPDEARAKLTKNKKDQSQKEQPEFMKLLLENYDKE